MTGLDAETSAMVGQTLERFVGERYDPADRLSRLHQGSVDHRLNWPLLAELGVLGLPLDVDEGGMGACAADLSLALRVLARGLVLEPVADALVATSLLAFGTGASRTQALEQAASGNVISVVVGLPLGEIRVETAGTGMRLRGIAKVVPFAVQADEWLVAARDADGVPHVLRIPVTQAGVRVRPFRLMDGRPAAELHFGDVVLDASHHWMSGPGASHALAHATDLLLAAHAADAVGVMDHLLGLTREYLRTRVQFGVAIGTFQALQHRLADMQMLFLEARALLRSWTMALDSGADQQTLDGLRRALPRVIANAGRQVGQEAIQMHGGMGVTEELVVSHCNARLQVTRSLLQNWTHAVSKTKEVRA